MNDKANIQRKISSRENIGLTASVIQKSDLLVHTFVTDYPSIILLKRGKKTITIGTRKVILHAGDAVAIPANITCNVQNETDRLHFESTWIVCAPTIIVNIEKKFPAHRKLKNIAALKNLGAEFIKSFERGVHAIVEPAAVPDILAEHHVQEILIWLAYAGFVFDSNEQSTLPRKVRLMIAASPEKSWASKEVAQSFAMSEATFRRKLADHGYGFNEILIDVRMMTALTLLQVTDTSISEIAYQVGYESASRFSARFKQRFGFSPITVRSSTA